MERPGRKRAPWFYIALYGIVLFVALSHLSDVRDGLSSALSLCSTVLRGLCIAFVMNVLVDFLERKVLVFVRGGTAMRRVRRVLAIVITLIVCVGVLALLSGVILPALLDALAMVERWMHSDRLGWFGKIRVLLLNMGMDALHVEEYVDQVAVWLNEGTRYIRTQYAQVAVFALNLTETILGEAFGALISVITAIYALLCKEWFISLGRRLTLAVFPDRISGEILDVSHRLNRAFQGFVRGQVLSGVILGTMCAVSMSIFGMNHAGVVGVVVGVTALVPVVGAFVGGAFGAVLLLMSQGLMTAVWFIVLLLVLQQLEENLVYPRVVGDTVGLPSLLVLCSIIVGGKAMGVVGMICAVPICAVAYQKLLQKVWPEKPQKEKTHRLSSVREKWKNRKGRSAKKAD